MSKKKRKSSSKAGSKAGSKASAEAAPAAPFHSAFAGLAALKSSLPEGEAPADPSPSSVSSEEGPKRAAKVVLRREKKGRGGKTVVRVQGLVGDPAGWASRMKKGLGCGAVVEGGAEEEEVVLLGDLLERAASWLEAEGAAKKVIRGN